tara:strand:- start:47020 stop:47235 length:216 start_codon:yes stop_codon:yes gene_type:complete
MNWQTWGVIAIYASIAFFFIGIMIYGCVKEHVSEAGTEYERLMSKEPVEMEEIKDEIVPYPHVDDIPVTNL